MDNRHGHLYRPQEITRLRELIAAEPGDIFHRLRNGIDTFITGGMTGLAFGYAIEHHQPLLRHGGTHPSRFAHDRKRNRRQLRQHALNAILARYLLLARGQEDQVIRLFPLCQLAESGIQ